MNLPKSCISDFLLWREQHAPNTLRLTKDKFAYTYHIEETRMNTDPFHRKAIKQFDRPLYHSIEGYTKRAELSLALESLKGYGAKQPSFTKIKSDPHMLSCYNRAVTDAMRAFMPDSPLTRLSLANAVDIIPKGTSAGFSFPGKKKGEVIEEIFDTASYMQHFIQKDRFVYVPPCKLALRGHLKSVDEPKTRAVWVYPAEVIALESKWAIPLSQHFTYNVREMFNGADAMSRIVAHVNKYADKRYSKTILDWSKFDQTVPSFVIDSAFSVMRSCFDDRYVEHEGNNIYQGETGERQSDRLWQFLKTYFTRTKLMLPSGDIIRKVHGVPSGSSFTAIVDTIANYIVCHFLMYLSNTPRPIYEHYLGDDAEHIHWSEQAIHKRDLHTWSALASSLLNMTMNADKVIITQGTKDHKVIGYNVAHNALIRYDEYGDTDREWFKMLLYAESDIEDLATSATRLYAFYLLGGAHSPLFCQYYKYFLGVYPMIVGHPLPMSRKVKRSLYNILGTAGMQYFTFPKLDEINKLQDPWLLTMKH